MRRARKRPRGPPRIHLNLCAKAEWRRQPPSTTTPRPAVLGRDRGGQAGLSLGARLKLLGVPHLIVEAHGRGAELQSLKLEELLPAAPPQDAQERAILSQSMRLVFLTAVVLEEVASSIERLRAAASRAASAAIAAA